MYKAISIGKKITIAFNTFPKTAKKSHKVYKIGFHKWNTHEDTTYSVVFPYNFRIMLYFNKYGIFSDRPQKRRKKNS